MAGTVRGGRKAASTNKTRYGANFYETIGALGGKKSRGGGFAKNPDLAREAGRRGGMASRRRKSTNPSA
jgi:general stress protein YciG